MSEPMVRLPAELAALLTDDLERAFATTLVHQMRLRLHVGGRPWLVVLTRGQYPEVNTAGAQTGRRAPGYIWEAVEWDDEEGVDAIPDYLGKLAFATVGEALADAGQALAATKGGDA